MVRIVCTPLESRVSMRLKMARRLHCATMHAIWMVLGAFLFASMGVGVKLASAQFTTAELVFYRGVFSCLLVWILMRSQGIALRSRVPWMHAWRSLIGNLSLAGWFFSITALPLATAMTLNYTSSMWMVVWILAVAILRGRDWIRQGPLMASVLLSFIGVVMVLKPTLQQNQWLGGLVGLASGITAAMAYLQVAALGKVGEPEARTVFYFALGSAVLGLIGMAFNGVTPLTPQTWPAAKWLIPIGVLAGLGQLCITRAYNGGSTILMANLQYSAIVFASFYSLFLFGDQIPLLGWAGMFVIVMSNILGTTLRARVLHAPTTAVS